MRPLHEIERAALDPMEDDKPRLRWWWAAVIALLVGIGAAHEFGWFV